MEDIIKELKKILPEENFKKEPESSMFTIKELEHKYGIDTDYFLNNKVPNMSEEDKDKWLSAYETMIFFSS